MKILCIIAQNIKDIKSGGAHGSRRNYDSICEVNGMEHTYTCIISEGAEFKKYPKMLTVPMLDNKVESAFAALFGCKVYKRKYEKDILKYIAEVKPELVYLDTSKMGRLAKRISKEGNCKIIVYLHNIESDYSMNQIRHRGIVYILSYLASYYNEALCLKKADKVICITERDAARALKLYGRKTDAIIPVSFRDRYEEKNVHLINGKNLLFVGSLFPPNYDGIKWFVENVMNRLPDVHLTIVGKDFEKADDKLARENVNVIGTVENLDEYYYRYPVMVMPIQYGAGMKVKTAEAMMFGKIIIGTNEAFEGYDIKGCSGLYNCRTADEFVYCIRKVFSNPVCINKDARDLFLRKYEFEATKEIFRETLIK